ncbi:MAG: helix-turn-helix transcriptional regulator [Nocardioidaceae bacterium]
MTVGQELVETTVSGVPPGAMTPGFVGRDHEFFEVVNALRNPGAVVLVEGEAGVGKSRLVQEFLRSSPVSDNTVLFGMCPPFRDPFTLGPIVAALRATCPDVSALRLDGLAGALRPIFPEWADGLPPLPEPLEDAKAERHRLFAALIQVLGQLGVSLLVVEDLHWADESTLEFLLLLASQPRDGISLLLTFRPDDVPSDSLLLRLTSRMAPGALRKRVSLTPFDVTRTTALMSSMLNDEPIDEAFASYLQERTEGLPLAVEESVRLLHDRSSLEYRHGVWERRAEVDLDVPPLVRDAVLERVQSLSDDAQQVLRSAAVLSESVDVDTIIAVSDLSKAHARKAIAEAVSSGLLGEDLSGLVAFRHVLASKAVYDALSALDRRSLHLRAGHALENVRPQPVAQLVSHFRRANDVGNWALYGELAAEMAISAGDDSTGVVLLTELVNAAELPLRTRSRLAKRLAGAEVFRRSVDGELVRRVIETLRLIVETDGMVARDIAEIRSPLGRLLMQRADFEAGRAELERAIPDLSHDPEESTRAMVFLGHPYGSTWHVSKHIDWLRRAAEMQPDSMSDIDKMTLTVDRMTTLLLLGEESGWDLAARMPVVATTVKEGLQATRGHGNAGYTAMLWGRYPAAHHHLATALALADAGRFQRIHDPILASAAHLDWFTGRWDGLADRVNLIGLEGGERLPVLEAILVARLLEAAEGNVHLAEERLVGLLDEVSGQHVPDLYVAVAAALASLQLDQGRVHEALQVTQHPMQEITRKGAWVWATEIAPIRVEAMIVSGQVEEARWLTTAFARGIRGLDAPAPAAALKLCQALLAQARGDDPASVARRFRDVAATWQRLPRPFDAALAREREADNLIASGAKEEGSALLNDVRSALIDLGALADAERVVSTLRGLGVEVRGVQRGGRRSYGDELSPRELDVVHLLVSGLTNKEIGKLLVLSPKTIARHLDSARRKLGVTSRTALAVKAVEAGIVPDEPPRGIPRLHGLSF